MKFGAMIAPRISDWRIACEIENLGYDAVWVSDSQMLWSDCYATLALVAQHTSRIQVGTGVTNSLTRVAPVAANAVATINKLAPGRTFIGIGTGFSSMAAMGQASDKVSAFRDYIRVLRGLLHAEEVLYGPKGQERPIRFLEPDLGFINVETPAKIYVAANGPKALEIAGAYGDGCISANDWMATDGDRIFADRRAAVREGAAKSGRLIPERFSMIGGTFVCILRPGETLKSDRVVDEIGALTVVGSLHAWWEIAQKTGNSDHVPNDCRDVWDRYLQRLRNEPIDAERMFQRIHQGHATYLHPDEREFVTPEIIRAGGGLVGEPDEIIARIRSYESAGMDELPIMPALANAREHFRAFRELVMDRY